MVKGLAIITNLTALALYIHAVGKQTLQNPFLYFSLYLNSFINVIDKSFNEYDNIHQAAFCYLGTT